MSEELYGTVFDTETSGFKKNGLCQIAGVSIDRNFQPVNSFNFLVIPEGFDEIEPKAAEITGHTMERCEAQGVPLRLALSILKHSVAKSKFTICHNYGYDSKVVDIGCRTIGEEDFLFRKAHICTMLASMNLVNIPGPHGRPKWPKLQEAYKWAFGETFDNAHDAMADVNATVRLLQFLAEHHPDSIPRA